MKLVICEKPSVGAAVAAALGVTGMRQPSWSRPDLIAMPSSPTLKSISSISTLVQDSGSQPSLL